MLNHLKQHFGSRRTGGHGGLDIARHVGPGLLVTVGFIDPGNWASNMAAGSQFGYALLWIVTLSTIMLIVLQHNAAHLGIAGRLSCRGHDTLPPPHRGTRGTRQRLSRGHRHRHGRSPGWRDCPSNALWAARARGLRHRGGSIDGDAHDELLQARRAMDHRLRRRGRTLVFG